MGSRPWDGERCHGRRYYAPDRHVVYCHCSAQPEAQYTIGHTEVTNNNDC